MVLILLETFLKAIIIINPKYVMGILSISISNLHVKNFESVS